MYRNDAVTLPAMLPSSQAFPLEQIPPGVRISPKKETSRSHLAR